jgi:glycosyltransferase involved in cell wall biosynthesis
MRILHVIRGLTNSSGTTHIVGPLAEEQARLGHEVSVYFVEKGSESSVLPDPQLVESICFPVTALGGHPGLSLPLARRLAATVGTFDVVHVHAIWNFATLAALRAAGRAGVPAMVAPQGSLEPWALAAGSWKRRLYARRLEKPLLNRASRLQALTETEAAQCRAFGLTAPAVVIPNGVRPDWLDMPRRSLAADLGLPAGTRTLLSLSRLHPKKGIDVLIRGFAAFAPAQPDMTLVIAGGDAGSGYGAALRRLVSELSLRERCRFLGEVGAEAKRRVLAGADAFALASHSEGLPVAALEAMAAGLPVVVTPGCNLPEVAVADAGVVVDPVPDGVAAALARLFTDPEYMRRQGGNGRRLVAERFTWPAIAERTIASYREMIAEARLRQPRWAA